MKWLSIQQLKVKSGSVRLRALERLCAEPDATLVKPLASVLDDPRSDVRRAAVIGLNKVACSSAVEPLTTALSDESNEIRELAVEGSRSAGDAHAIPFLLPSLEDGDARVRWQASQSLVSLGWHPESDRERALYYVATGELEKAVRLGEHGLTAIVQVLRTGVYYKRIEAAQILGQLMNSKAVKPLLEALTDSECSVRNAAAEALSKVGDARAVEPLIETLKDSEPHVRCSAAKGLVKLGDERAVGPLADLMTDSNAEVRMAAAEALGHLRSERALEPLCHMLRDPDRDVREMAADAMAELNREEAIYPLVLAKIDATSTVRQAAARALEHIDPRWKTNMNAHRAIPLLQEGLKNDDYWVRQSAAAVLQELGGQMDVETHWTTTGDGAHYHRHQATEYLLALLTDDDAHFRQAAAEALGRVGDQRALEPLTKGLSDRDRWVRRSNLHALDMLRWHPENEVQLAQSLIVQGKWSEVVKLGESAVDPLVEAINFQDAQSRNEAIKALKGLQEGPGRGRLDQLKKLNSELLLTLSS